MAASEEWPQAARRCVSNSEPAILVSVVGVHGSSPREVGASQVVGDQRIWGSVGGGVLEHMAIQRARRMLRDSEQGPQLIDFPLDPDSLQCCGGVVVLMFEPLDSSHWVNSIEPGYLSHGVWLETSLPAGQTKVFKQGQGWPQDLSGSDARLQVDGAVQTLQRFLRTAEPVIALFGAGHVGRAVAGALAPLACQTWWVDARENEFPEILPDQTRRWISDDFEAIVDQLPPGSFVLIMTHEHPLDYAICRSALARPDLAYVGLIGSETKRRRFQRQLGVDGLDESAVDSLVCPIGLPEISGKHPAVIAASVVAQLLGLFPSPPSARRRGIGHQEASASCIAGSF